MRLVPRGWFGMKKGYALPVALVDAGRSIVLRQHPPAHPRDAIWSFHIVPMGVDRCRLLTRVRRTSTDSPPLRRARWIQSPS